MLKRPSQSVVAAAYELGRCAVVMRHDREATIVAQYDTFDVEPGSVAPFTTEMALDSVLSGVFAEHLFKHNLDIEAASTFARYASWRTLILSPLSIRDVEPIFSQLTEEAIAASWWRTAPAIAATLQRIGTRGITSIAKRLEALQPGQKLKIERPGMH